MSMYGPYRKIVAVGSHEADGTIITLECGHTWKLVSHMHMSEKSIGEVSPCGGCRGGRPVDVEPAKEVIR